MRVKTTTWPRTGIEREKGIDNWFRVDRKEDKIAKRRVISKLRHIITYPAMHIISFLNMEYFVNK